jgi:mono/diheme cytochrome c family protein
VLESDQRLAAITLHSIEGPLKVKGVQWNNAGMPAWGKTMTDTQIAQILTFIRGNKDWGNNAPAVTPETVKAVRARFAGRTKTWSQAELDAEKWDAAP